LGLSTLNRSFILLAVQICDKLLFKVDTMFAIGSPVSLFLSLRGASAHLNHPLHGKHIFPKGVRLYNVYHALDPVAYRLEPLILGAFGCFFLFFVFL
jgi:hypothetical protein